MEAGDSVLAGFDADMNKLVAQDFASKGVDIVTNAFAQEAKEIDGGLEISYKVNDKLETVEANMFLSQLDVVQILVT